MNVNATNLVLRFNQGRFTFNRFDRMASDAELFALAQKVNAFQTESAQVVKVQVFSVH